MLSASAKEFIPFGGEDDSGMSSRDDDDSRKTNVGQGSDFGAGVDATSYDGFEGDLGLYAQVQLEAELLEIMAESFSEFSPECLQVALAKSDWDLDRASEGLVSALQASDPERSSKPCRHLLLEGGCFRRDCAFSHNFSLTPCRFWLYGRCMYSREECAFRHDLDVPVQGTIHNIPEAEESEPDYDRDSFNRDSPRGGQEGSNFPSLPLKPPAPHASVRSNETGEVNDGGNEKDVLLEAVSTAPDHKKGNHGRQGAKNRRKARFKAVNIQALMREDSSNIGNVERHDGVGQATWGPSVGPSFATVVRSADNPVGAGQRRGDGEVRGVRNSNSGVVQRSKGTWVSTGDAVASQYERARKEAAELARARNKLFTSATEAFRRGHGKAARDLARRGRELNAEMKEKHRQAANAIFADRNPGDQIFERKTIDLHALHVREALEVLPRELEALAERNVDRVRVLAGTGHHSKGPTSKARLIPAVETFCHTRGLSYRLVADHGTAHVGMVEIDLSGLSR